MLMLMLIQTVARSVSTQLFCEVEQDDTGAYYVGVVSELRDWTSPVRR